MGLKDEKYGEIVAAFLEQQQGSLRPPDEELREWVQTRLGGYNVPVHVFWVGAEGHIVDFPKTSSGKIKKSDLRNLGNALIGGR